MAELDFLLHVPFFYLSLHRIGPLLEICCPLSSHTDIIHLYVCLKLLTNEHLPSNCHSFECCCLLTTVNSRTLAKRIKLSSKCKEIRVLTL